MKIYRLTLAKYVESAFSGEGSRRVGGRWTPPGYRAVYTSGSIALAVLETLVHADAAVLPRHFVIPLELPDDMPMAQVSRSRLPGNWQDTPAPAALQAEGLAWLEKNETCVLRVPSALVPLESNYVLNPAHRDFSKLKPGRPEAFEINQRLL